MLQPHSVFEQKRFFSNNNLGKTDPELGREIHRHLFSQGLETPQKKIKKRINNTTAAGELSDEEKIKKVTKKFICVCVMKN